jgi:DNA-directed RNA polymerase specialized sigma24 family protein
MADGRTAQILQHIRTLAEFQGKARVPDRELLERFVQRNDENAFAMLVRRHGPMVWHVCARVLGNEADAEDAFQATFLILIRTASSRGWHDSVGNWLYLVAYRAAVRARRAAAMATRLCPLVLERARLTLHGIKRAAQSWSTIVPGFT